jgi:stearoyl-CoA desaturase (Delta-9 desaturase)
MFVIVFLTLHWYISLFFQSFFLHRYGAHGAFRMSRFWERVFFLMSYVAHGSSYFSARAYAIMHRMHHTHTDTEDDPHSPLYQNTVMKMMWRTRNYMRDIYLGKMVPDAKYTKNVPDWPLLDKIGNSAINRIAWVGVYVWLYVQFAPSLWFLPLVLVHTAMGPIQGAIINWRAHRKGYVNFEVDDHSKNLMRLDVFFIGEGYHNNHHKHPGSAKFGTERFEFDATYQVIRLFSKLGIIRLRKEPVMQPALSTVQEPAASGTAV